MTDSWNDAPGKSPHDKAMSYNSAKPPEEDFGQDYGKLYDSGLAILKANRFHLERAPNGSHCGHNVYIRSKPKPVSGISYPVWFKVLRLIETAEDEAELTTALLKSQSASADIQQFWAPLTQPVSGAKSTPLQGHVERLLRIDDNNRRQNESEPFALGIQVTNFTEQVAKSEQAPRAHLPPVDWFDERVRQLKFTDIFTLWPEAESEMLMLILGKAWLGRSSSQLVGESKVLEHTFRSVGIIVGEDAGLGKSTIFDKLSRATNKTGYRWSNFRDISEQFGMAEVATSDITYKDDVTGPTLAKLISSENTKILASGGRIFVEDKFQKGTSLHARCVVLANTNEWNPRLAYSLDPGTVDRIKLLTTFRRNELQERCRERSTEAAENSPNYAPFVHIPWLANRLDVSEECLMLWASRLCVDKFRELTFWRGDVPTEGLRLEVHRISSHLVYSFNKDCTRALVSLMMLSHMMFTHLESKRTCKKPYPMRELNAEVLKQMFSDFRCLVTDSDMYRLKSMIKLHWELKGRPDIHPWSGIRKLNLLSVASAEAASNECMAGRKPLGDLVKALFGGLQLRDGFTGSSDIVWVTAAWQSCEGYLGDIENLARCLEGLVSKHAEDSLAQVAEAIHRASSTGKADSSWLESAQYTPKGIELLLLPQSKNFDCRVFAEELDQVAWQC